MLLAIDTASRTISLALHDGERVVAENSWRSANHHSVELAPAVATMLQRADMAPAALTAIAVTQGPGSYTGLRIGLGLAKGLAMSAGMALVGVPTLDVLAEAQHPPRRDERLCAVAPAGRGRASVGFYTWQTASGWRSGGLAAVENLTWEELAAQLTAEGLATRLAGELPTVGDKGHAAIAAPGGPVEVVAGAANLRRAGFLAEIGWRRWRAGNTDDPATLVPFYAQSTQEGAV